MSNYHIIPTIENVKWPEYVSGVVLEGEKFLKAENVLEMALVTLEAYGGPNYTISKLNNAVRKCFYLYEMLAHLIDANNEIKECKITVLYEPWMKANSIAQACFEFQDDTSLIIKRKKNVKYYKNTELLYKDQPESKIPFN